MRAHTPDSTTTRHFTLRPRPPPAPPCKADDDDAPPRAPALPPPALPPPALPPPTPRTPRWGGRRHFTSMIPFSGVMVDR